MQQNHLTINSMAAECIETSVHLRKSLINGQEMAANVRRDVATAANLLEAIGIKLVDIIHAMTAKRPKDTAIIPISSQSSMRSS